MDAQTPLTTVEKAAFLTEVDLFRDVPSDMLAELAGRMEDGWHEPGDVLLEPDMPDVRLWVVLSGRMRVVCGDESRPDLGRGDAFGLLASLGLPQLETVTVEEPCRTLSVAPDEYLDAIADSTAFAIANLRALGRRVRAREQCLTPAASSPADDIPRPAATPHPSTAR
jgi:CRP-like cAMP-binding protein